MSRAGFLVFAVVMVGLLAALNRYVFRAAKRTFRLGPGALRAVSLVMWVSVATMVLSRVAERLWFEPPVRTLQAVASTVQLAVIITAVLLSGVDLAGLAQRAAVRIWLALRKPASPLPAEVPPLPASPELQRRAFIAQVAAGSAFLIGSSSSLYGALGGRHDYSIEHVVVKLPGLAKALDGYSIAQLSDVHIGTFVGEAELSIAEDLLRQTKPDLIVLTGDLLDHDARLAERLGRFVRRLGSISRGGVVVISGNHDFFAGIEAFEAAVRKAGGRLLRNQAEVIGDASAGFALLGVDDVWSRRVGGGPDLARAVRSLPRLGGKLAPPRDLPRVLLCHNPSFFKEAAGHVALQLSGHTHGGQVNLGVRPADYVLPGGWVAGSYRLNGSQLYVNRGFGTVGPPARIGAPPEVTRIVLSA